MLSPKDLEDLKPLNNWMIKEEFKMLVLKKNLPAISILIFIVNMNIQLKQTFVSLKMYLSNFPLSKLLILREKIINRIKTTF